MFDKIRFMQLKNIFAPESYPDVFRPFVLPTIEKYGQDEWQAAVLTNEIHGHIGIYSIMGVKMGIRALELFQAEKGKVSVVSFSGAKPPVSCIIDGLQISTGATLGQGLISVPQVDEPAAEAFFSFEGKSLHLKIHPVMLQKIKEDVSLAYNKWQYTSPYWEHIRSLALRYWVELDRKELFVTV